jgi:DNA polymerase
MSAARILHLDFETFGTRDLAKVGMHKYIADPAFEVTVIGWAFDDDPPRLALWPNTKNLPGEIKAHIDNGGHIHAWHAAFEWTVLSIHYGQAMLPPEAMICTMQRALAHGLPGKLSEAGPALKLAHVKDVAARKLMLRMSRPSKEGGKPLYQTDMEGMLQLGAYCEADVEAEREMGRNVPMLSPFETRVAALDARINNLGALIDVSSAASMLWLAQRETASLNKFCEVLTCGEVTSPGTQTARLLKWLTLRGVRAPDVKAKTVADLIRDIQNDTTAQEVLKLRALAAKGSVAKLQRMLDCVGQDHRAKGLLQYYGAGRTGRWAGRLIQVQNLPRPQPGLDIDAALKLVNAIGLPADRLALFYESPLAVIASCLRAMIIPGKGKIFLCLDLAQIEARVLAWLAGQKDIVGAFARGEDIYVVAAAKVGSQDRNLGKVLTLACGFGMGGAKFRETAEGYGVRVEEEAAYDLVMAWRVGNSDIVSLWHTMSGKVMGAIEAPGVVVHIGQWLRAVVRNGILYIRKPNGGCLVYHNPRIEAGEIVFDGVDPISKQWGRQRTYGGKLVENVTQAVARDVLAEAILRVHDAYVGALPTLTVHDEAVWELYEGVTVSEVDSIQFFFNRVPAWAPGLPVASDRKMLERYGK